MIPKTKNSQKDFSKLMILLALIKMILANFYQLHQEIMTVALEVVVSVHQVITMVALEVVVSVMTTITLALIGINLQTMITVSPFLGSTASKN